MKTRTLEIPDNALVLFALHLALAWVGVFVATVVLDLSLPHPLNRLFGVPGAAPFFPGIAVLGLCTGFLAIRRLPTVVACFVFLPPLALVLWNAYINVYLYQPPFGGWHYYWMINWSNHCGANECISAQTISGPLVGAVAYSIAALIGIIRGQPRPAEASHA